jgi:hypothetical protein
MINAFKRVVKARENYNPITGEGANEFLLALLEYEKKSKEVDKALAKVGKILKERDKK